MLIRNASNMPKKEHLRTRYRTVTSYRS